MTTAMQEIDSRTALAERVADELLHQIVQGIYASGERLPPEPVLAERAGVSRLTLREAIKALRQRGVVSVQQGRGTFVTGAEQWSVLDSAVLNARAAAEQGYELAHELTELRRIVERGIAELAAVRRTEADLTRLTAALEQMRLAWDEDDRDTFGDADLEFHNALLRASGNTVATTLFHSVEPAMRRIRRRTSSNDQLAENALHYHAKILAAVRRRAHRQAGALMDEHLAETEQFTAELSSRDDPRPEELAADEALAGDAVPS